MKYRPQDLILARRASKAGARYSLRIILEARAAGIPVSLGFALIEQESDFRNYFGSDPTIFVGAGSVTKNKYLTYKGQRGHKLMQGVGPAQLTWWETQDSADRLGGCWKAAVNIRVGFQTLAADMKAHGLKAGVAAYNGAGPAATRYANEVLAKRDRWHAHLS